MKRLKTNITNIYGDQGKIWLDDLPRIVDELAKEYGLSSLNPIKNLSYHYVLVGFQGHQPIILKLGLDIAGLKRESAALKVLSRFGSVKVLAESPSLLLTLIRDKDVVDMHIKVKFC
ncbi:hypothetical protein [Candidatus Tisiphia endosymbiont of Ditula angustiorana]|uniref:hypothetical protein n=1 Tax=Candidatus Tisiphia endosymbiont of Ditula angustiorana TaxID=3066272 RepID=UPI00312CBD7C